MRRAGRSFRVGSAWNTWGLVGDFSGENERESRPGLQKGSAGAFGAIFFPAQKIFF